MAELIRCWDGTRCQYGYVYENMYVDSCEDCPYNNLNQVRREGQLPPFIETEACKSSS